LPICCERTELAEFGTGYPLYFEFVLYCIVMLVIMFLCLGLYGLYTNYTAGDCYQLEANCDPSTFINLISIPNKIFHAEEYYYQTWVNLGTIIIVMISLHIFRRMQKLTENECDRGLTSPSDYSIWLSKLPKGEYTEADIRRIIEESVEGRHQNFEIKKVVMAFNISEFMMNCRKINALDSKLRGIQQYEKKNGKLPEGPSPREIELEKASIERQVQEFINEAEKMDERMIQKTTGDAFVIFKEQDGFSHFH